MGHSFIVVDDFYDRPLELRKFALKQKFFECFTSDGKALIARASRLPRAYRRRTVERVARVLRFDVRFELDSLNGEFRTVSAADQAGQTLFVHTDPTRWTGVLSLRPGDNRGSATSFYRHRATGLDGVHDDAAIMAACKRLRVSAPELFELLSRDMGRPARWELLMSIPYAFNRYIFFNGEMFHRSADGFGKEPRSGKLTQVVSFDLLGRGAKRDPRWIDYRGSGR